MGEEGKGVSRRDLLSVFGRGAKRLQRDLAQTTDQARSPTAGTPEAGPGYDRVLRPPEDVVRAFAGGHETWNVDLRPDQLEVGESAIVAGADLPEHLVVVRVHEAHLAACSAECPIDGSDLVWSQQDDRLRCPSCWSRWRLDGEVVRGPADSPLGRFIVDVFEDDTGAAELRIHKA